MVKIYFVSESTDGSGETVFEIRIVYSLEYRRPAGVGSGENEGLERRCGVRKTGPTQAYLNYHFSLNIDIVLSNQIKPRHITDLSRRQSRGQSSSRASQLFVPHHSQQTFDRQSADAFDGEELRLEFHDISWQIGGNFEVRLLNHLEVQGQPH